MSHTSSQHYRERLSPPWWFWLAAVFWALTLGIAYGYAISTTAGVAVGLAAFALAALGLSRVSATVLVDERGLNAGSAHLPWNAVGTVEALDAASAKVRRGGGADPRAYLMLRGWVSTAVAVEVRDPRDPTPYWFVSTRSPDRLAATLQRGVLDAAQGSVGSTEDADMTGSSALPSAEEGTT